MPVYTLTVFGADVAVFVGYAVMGAGGGCFGLAIQDYYTVHALASLLLAFSVGVTLFGGWPVSVRDKAGVLHQAFSWVAKSIMPFHRVCFALQLMEAALDLKGFEKCS